MKHFDSYENYLKFMIKDKQAEIEIKDEIIKMLAEENEELRAELRR